MPRTLIRQQTSTYYFWTWRRTSHPHFRICCSWACNPVHNSLRNCTSLLYFIIMKFLLTWHNGTRPWQAQWVPLMGTVIPTRTENWPQSSTGDMEGNYIKKGSTWVMEWVFYKNNKHNHNLLQRCRNTCRSGNHPCAVTPFPSDPIHHTQK